MPQKTSQKAEMQKEPTLSEQYASFLEAELMQGLSDEEREVLSQSRKRLEAEPIDLIEGMKELRERLAKGEIDLNYG